MLAARVRGMPAILLEVIDFEDPIEIGNTERYRIDVTNQGSAPAANVRIQCELEPNQVYLSAGGATAARSNGRSVVFAPAPEIAPKAKSSWEARVRAVSPGDVRFSVSMTADQISRPVNETEATNQYEFAKKRQTRLGKDP